LNQRRYKTLYSKSGQISIREKDSLNIPEEFASWEDELSPQNGLEIVAEFVKSGSEQKDASNYVGREEFEGLKKRFEVLERKLASVCQESNPQNIEAALLISVRDMLSKICNRFSYKFQNNHLTIFMVSKKFSKKNLDQISKIEVDLSKRYPKIIIEIEPLVNYQDIPEGSQEIW
jgi:hypothetical protein